MPLTLGQREWVRGAIDGLTALSDNRWAMPSDQLATILTELTGVVERCVLGAVVEMGCAGCSTSLRLAALLQLLGEGPGRPLHLYDSFQGFPEPTVEDEQGSGWRQREDAHLAYPAEDPERLFRRWGDGLPVPIVHTGFFQEEPDPANPHPDPVALALLDCDMYASLKTALRIVWPRLTLGGVTLIHDYDNPTWPGVRRATGDYFSQENARTQVGRWELKHKTILLVSKREPRT